MTDNDLEAAERACRSLAARYRQTADRRSDPDNRNGALESAVNFERLADKMKQLRKDTWAGGASCMWLGAVLLVAVLPPV